MSWWMTTLKLNDQESLATLNTSSVIMLSFRTTLCNWIAAPIIGYCYSISIFGEVGLILRAIFLWLPAIFRNGSPQCGHVQKLGIQRSRNVLSWSSCVAFQHTQNHSTAIFHFIARQQILVAGVDARLLHKHLDYSIILISHYIMFRNLLIISFIERYFLIENNSNWWWITEADLAFLFFNIKF